MPQADISRFIQSAHRRAIIIRSPRRPQRAETRHSEAKSFGSFEVDRQAREGQTNNRGLYRGFLKAVGTGSSPHFWGINDRQWLTDRQRRFVQTGRERSNYRMRGSWLRKREEGAFDHSADVFVLNLIDA
jgi:hypothetical protein